MNLWEQEKGEMVREKNSILEASKQRKDSNMLIRLRTVKAACLQGREGNRKEWEKKQANFGVEPWKGLE